MTGPSILNVALLALMAALAVSLAVSLYRLKTTPPPDAPKAWLARKAAGLVPRKPVCVCAGDSITHGVLSANYVDVLRHRLPELEFVNAGINSELAFNLYERVDDIVACDPDFVTVLIGTNDANATFGLRNTLGYVAMQRLPEAPSPEFYREHLLLIVRKLKRGTRARLALASIPPIGEDPYHYAWLRSEAYGQAAKSVAEEEGVRYLPLREAMAAYLESAPRASPPAFDSFGKLGRRAILANRVFGRSFDAISAVNGFRLLVDGIHLNSHGAAIVANLVETFLREPPGNGDLD